jgi:hypothetical protein
MADLRHAIEQGKLAAFVARFHREQAESEPEIIEQNDFPGSIDPPLDQQR